MSNDDDKFVTTFIFPNEYSHHLNQVAGLSTKHITFLERIFLSKAGHKLTNYPIADCVSITYKDERPVASIIFGVLLISLMAFVGYMVVKYWDSLTPGTRVPAGLLFLALIYGLRSTFLSRRHRLIFAMSNGSKLTWKTRPGDYKYKEASAAKAVEFAKSIGILNT
jgi:hypothetical protein